MPTIGSVILFQVGVTAGAVLIVLGWLLTFLPVAERIPRLQYAVLPLVSVGFGGIVAASIFGVSILGLINTATTKVQTFSTNIAPALAYIIPVVVGLTALGFFINGVWTGEVSKRHVLAACVVPISISAIPGAFGHFFTVAYGFFPVGLVMWLYHLGFDGIGKVI